MLMVLERPKNQETRIIHAMTNMVFHRRLHTHAHTSVAIKCVYVCWRVERGVRKGNFSAKVTNIEAC